MAAGKLSTHVLDTATGHPAGGMRIQLFWVEHHADVPMKSLVTNADGRTDGPLLDAERFSAGCYKLLFHVGDYFAEQGNADAKKFLDKVAVVFVVDDASRPYHVPLLVSPWAYSTYRGS
jgi:5-hydroxyisourate hydrolase